LVVTIVHHPQDSRIRFREIEALLDSGWDVTYAAPFTGYGLSSKSEVPLHQIDLPRASGRRRLPAVRAARKLLRAHGPAHDVVLLHDPELLVAQWGLGLPHVVWDVHEDTAAAVTLKPWLPRALRPVVRWVFARIERLAERKVHLILAEYAYQDRFKHPHVVVPNVNRVPAAVPPPDQPRVVYVGSVTRARGAEDLVEVARLIAAKTDGALKLQVIGPASGDVAAMLNEAAGDGVLDWPGFMPATDALAAVRGSIAGLSLLHDEPNYRVSLPTKVVEYMANGVPVVTTPLPLARDLVEQAGCGIVVPFRDAGAAADAVLSLWSDPARRHAMGAAGHTAARDRFDWAAHARTFVAELGKVAPTR
jgi:glycosyltransferase involved in cell wall biosynthesis